MEQKIIRNESLQALEVYLNTPQALKCFVFKAGEAKVVPAEYISEQIKKLVKRRMISVSKYN